MPNRIMHITSQTKEIRATVGELYDSNDDDSNVWTPLETNINTWQNEYIDV